MTPIPFNRPYVSSTEIEHVTQALQGRKLCGDGPYTKKVHAFLEERYRYPKVLLTTSCTDALELAALVARIEPGDEVIVPAFTFVSSANAFALRGAKIVFADSLPHNPNIDPDQVAALITPKTKAIVAVHYAGVCCDMRRLTKIAADAGVIIVEDAAQALDSTYESQPAGSFGRFAAFSFHETKNLSAGEGGMLVLNHPDDVHRAEIIREKGTNRSAFIRGEVDRYGWVEVGSSFLPSELNAALLYAQLQHIDRIQARRRAIFELYDARLRATLTAMDVGVPDVPANCGGNAHAYYITVHSVDERTKLIGTLKEAGIQAASHYLSLHKSPYFSAKHDGRPLPHSDRFSDCLLRLPLFYELTDDQVHHVCDKLLEALSARRPQVNVLLASSAPA